MGIEAESIVQQLENRALLGLPTRNKGFPFPSAALCRGGCTRAVKRERAEQQQLRPFLTLVSPEAATSPWFPRGQAAATVDFGRKMMCSLSEPIGGETCQGFSGKAHFSQPSGLHSCSHWPWLQGAKEMRDVMASSPSSIPGPDIQIRAAPNLLYRLIVIRLTNTALLSPVASDLVDARATSMLAFITWWREFAVSARSGTRLHGIYWLVALVETCCCKLCISAEAIASFSPTGISHRGTSSCRMERLSGSSTGRTPDGTPSTGSMSSSSNVRQRRRETGGTTPMRSSPSPTTMS